MTFVNDDAPKEEMLMSKSKRSGTLARLGLAASALTIAASALAQANVSNPYWEWGQFESAIARPDAANGAPGRGQALATDLPNLPEAQVPLNKRTKSGFYITAGQTHALKQARPRELILIDIRSSAEIAFVGQADGLDAHIPFREFAHPPTWNPRTRSWKMERNPSFVTDVEHALSRTGADKGAVVVLMCRSGDRSAVAADVLADAGFSRVYTVVDGFEGDIGSRGVRDVNGWKNIGAPWRARNVAHLVYGAMQ